MISLGLEQYTGPKAPSSWVLCSGCWRRYCLLLGVGLGKVPDGNWALSSPTSPHVGTSAHLFCWTHHQVAIDLAYLSFWRPLGWLYLLRGAVKVGALQTMWHGQCYVMCHMDTRAGLEVQPGLCSRPASSCILQAPVVSQVSNSSHCTQSRHWNSPPPGFNLN